MQDRLIADANDVPDNPAQINKMMATTIRDFSNVTSLMRSKANQAQVDNLFNDVIIFDTIRDKANRKIIYSNIRSTLDRFIYTGNISCLDSWNATTR